MHWKELCRDPTLTSEKFEKSLGNSETASLKNMNSYRCDMEIYGAYAALKGQDSTFMCSGKAMRPTQKDQMEGCIDMVVIHGHIGYTLLCSTMSHHELHCNLQQGLISMTWNTPMERRDIFKAVWHGFERS